MALCGYPPEDLLLRPAFMQACEQTLRQVAQDLADLADLHLVIGHPEMGPGGTRTVPGCATPPERGQLAACRAGGGTCQA